MVVMMCNKMRRIGGTVTVERWSALHYKEYHLAGCRGRMESVALFRDTVDVVISFDNSPRTGNNNSS